MSYKAIKCIHFKLIYIGTKCVWIGSYYVKHNKQDKTKKNCKLKQHLKNLLRITKDRITLERCNNRPVTNDEQLKKSLQLLLSPAPDMIIISSSFGTELKNLQSFCFYHHRRNL